MWLPILGLVLGISLGLLTDFRIPGEYSNYLSIAILAALDTLLGGFGHTCRICTMKWCLYPVFSLTSFWQQV